MATMTPTAKALEHQLEKVKTFDEQLTQAIGDLSAFGYFKLARRVEKLQRKVQKKITKLHKALAEG